MFKLHIYDTIYNPNPRFTKPSDHLLATFTFADKDQLLAAYELLQAAKPSHIKLTIEQLEELVTTTRQFVEKSYSDLRGR